MGISLKGLKKNRLTSAEKWVLETIEGCEPETQSNGDVYWYKDGVCLFEQEFENGFLCIGYYNIWLVLKKEFGFSYGETNDLLANLLYDYTDNGKLKIII